MVVAQDYKGCAGRGWNHQGPTGSYKSVWPHPEPRSRAFEAQPEHQGSPQCHDHCEPAQQTSKEAQAADPVSAVCGRLEDPPLLRSLTSKVPVTG